MVPEPSPARSPEGPAQPQAPFYCDLCARKTDFDAATYEASGFVICSICLEDMIYAHDQQTAA